MKLNPLPRQGPRRRERLAQACFVAVLLIFSLQCWYLTGNSEPYPALLLPSFSSVVVDTDGSFSGLSADVTTTFADGSTQTCGIERLFAGAPSSHWQFMSRILFYPKDMPADALATTPGPVKTWIKTNMLPGFALGRARRNIWGGIEPETSRWLRKRLTDLYPQKNVSHAAIDWYTTTYSLTAQQWTGTRVENKHIEVPL